VIIFQYTDIERNFFTVTGAVLNPGKFHFVEGDRLIDAIELAEGINKAYENFSVKIYRQDNNGNSSQISDASINDDIEIHRGDRIVVAADEPEQKAYSVMVMGEVNRPGPVPISKQGTTLKEVFERAGGVKSTASLRLSRLYTGNSASYILEKLYGIKNDSRDFIDQNQIRITNDLVQLERMMMYRLSSVTTEDSAYFSIENHLRVLSEGSSFDLREINNTASAAATYIVRDGDVIIVPMKQSTVYLFGSIVKPGHIEYAEGKDAGYYIDLAGGLGEHSEGGKIMLIKGDSRKWISINDNPEIEEGDYIYVPRDEPRRFNYYVDIVSKYLSILGGAATVILLLVQLSKTN
jgi:protein involved in polysaccharide export with SLBB domain